MHRCVVSRVLTYSGVSGFSTLVIDSDVCFQGTLRESGVAIAVERETERDKERRVMLVSLAGSI